MCNKKEEKQKEEKQKEELELPCSKECINKEDWVRPFQGMDSVEVKEGLMGLQLLIKTIFSDGFLEKFSEEYKNEIAEAVESKKQKEHKN